MLSTFLKYYFFLLLIHSRKCCANTFLYFRKWSIGPNFRISKFIEWRYKKCLIAFKKILFIQPHISSIKKLKKYWIEAAFLSSKKGRGELLKRSLCSLFVYQSQKNHLLLFEKNFVFDIPPSTLATNIFPPIAFKCEVRVRKSFRKKLHFFHIKIIFFNYFLTHHH